ncbi:MAG: carbohydrate binding domain-containing protein [bacterium]
MGIYRNIFKWIFQKISPGEQNPEKRVDADRIMDNFNTLANSISVVCARGEFAKDGNSNGISTSHQCNLTLYTDKGIGGLLDNSDWVEISDGINVWQKKTSDEPTTNKDDELSFSNVNLIKGNGPLDYSDPNFISSLIITMRKSENPDMVRASRVQLQGKNCLCGEVIPRTEEDSTSIEESLASVITNFNVQHNEDGSHKEGVLLSSNLDSDCFSDEGFSNLIDGSFEFDPDGDGCAYPWSKYNEPSLALTTSTVFVGNYSQKITATQEGDGIELAIDDIRHIKGRKITVSAWAYYESSQVVIEVNDGFSTFQSEPFGVSNEWEKGVLTCTVSPNAENINIRIYLTSSGISYIDAVQITVGSHDLFYTEAPEIYIRKHYLESSMLNLIMGFER